MKTTTEKIRFVADENRRDRPDLAAILDSIQLGRPKKRNANGHTAHNEKLADLWESIADRIAAGEDEGAVFADIGARNRVDEDYVLNLWLLNGRSKVRAILRTRGRLSERESSRS